MQLIFGLQLDNPSLPLPTAPSVGSHRLGPKGLLQLLETLLGLGGHPNDIDYLRTEQYRQAVLRHLEQEGHAQEPPFYHRSFEADPLATAADLLARRDELLLAGWDFRPTDDSPARLHTLAELEAIFTNADNDLALSAGFADRFEAVLTALHLLPEGPFTEVFVNEPLDLLPPHFQRFFAKLESTYGLAPQPLSIELPTADTDLRRFQRRLSGEQSPSAKNTLQNDGSLLLLRARRSREAATFLSATARLGAANNPSQPASLLLTSEAHTLDLAMMQEGRPSLGTQSTSLARPTLQILKLVTAFLWEPVNPFHVLEFVSLAVKPLADELASRIASQVAALPGLQGDGWYAMINRYFEELAENEPVATVNEQRRQYNFWFERRRYDMNRKAPKADAMAMFDYLRQWAVAAFEDGGGRTPSLVVLSQQARRVAELLAALPEQELGYLELERIVRAIYEPSPVVLQPEEVGSLPHAMHPAAVIGQVRELWWWHFTQLEQPHFFSKWSKTERDWLAQSNVLLETPEQQNTRQRWQQIRPLLACSDRLLLVLPETVDGQVANPHPLFGDLQAAFANLDHITQDAAPGSARQSFAKHLKLPRFVPLEHRQLGRPQPFLRIGKLEQLARERESLTSLETLFYYPYQWFFRYKLRFNKSSILSVVPENTLMGNLAHRVFEKLLTEDVHNMTRSEVDDRVEREARRLLPREGAVLLMYGREPERVAFLNKVKYAAWSLITHIRENGWRVLKTEMELEGKFPFGNDGQEGTPVLGIADLVLGRDSEELAVLDIKWRGSGWREAVIRNEEDLQLVLYAWLASPPGRLAHTGYFVLDSGKLLARNTLAFRNAKPVAPDLDHHEVCKRVLGRMEATWHWRMGQLAEGLVEVRCRQTLAAIEDAYSEKPQFELLEMKGEDAKYDDYRVLINLVE